MTVRPVVGLSRIGLRTADDCFFPLMLESFRGVRRFILTTTSYKQEAAAVELFLEQPGGGNRYHYLGAMRIDDVPSVGLSRPDLRLQVALDTGRVLTAVLVGPRGSSKLRVALTRYCGGDTEMPSLPALMDVRVVVAAGHLDEMSRPGAPDAAAALSRDTALGAPIELFVHRSTSTTPINAEPNNLPRIRWLTERDDLRLSEVNLLHSIYRSLAQSRDPQRTRFAAAGMRSLNDRYTVRGTEPTEDPVIRKAQEAFSGREYGKTMTLLRAAREKSILSATRAELIDYWLCD